MSPIPSKQEYETNEIHRAQIEMDRIERAPLSERKEAAQDFYEAMRDDPATVAERLGWLLDGNYGYGQMVMAKRIVASPRMNREAALTNLVATFEWRCPQRMVAEAWKKLTAPQKKMLDAALKVVIAAAERAEE